MELRGRLGALAERNFRLVFTAGLHVAYAIVAALATVASANFVFTVLTEPSAPRAQAAA